MKLRKRVQVLTRKAVMFREKDLGDKKRIDLLVGAKKVEGRFIMKGEKSNTSETEMEESLLLQYCMKNHYIV